MDNPQRKRWTREEDKLLASEYVYRDPKSIRQVAHKLNRSIRSVEHRITTLGLNVHNHHRNAMMLTKEPNVHLAYIVGVYLSDGSVYKNQFYLESVDRDFCQTTLSSLDKILDGRLNKKIREVDRAGRRRTYRIKVASSDLVTWLSVITDSKNRIPREWLGGNRDYMLALFAGLLDGDGYVSRRKGVLNKRAYSIGLCGHELIYGAVRDYEWLAIELGIEYRKKYTKGGYGFVTYRFNNRSFLESGAFFTVRRKMRRIAEMRLMYGVRSTTTMTAPEESG